MKRRMVGRVSVLFIASMLLFSGVAVTLISVPLAHVDHFVYGRNTFAVTDVPSMNQMTITIALDRYAYRVNETMNMNLTIKNNQDLNFTNLAVNVTATSQRTQIVDILRTWTDQSITALGTLNLTQTSVIHSEGVYVLTVDVLNQTSGERFAESTKLLLVLTTNLLKPLIIDFVWSNYQPWYVNLQGQFEQIWAQYYATNGSQPYYWHIQVMRRHPTVNATYNLGPTLLLQWNMSVNGFYYRDPSTGIVTYYGANSAYAQFTKRCIEGYKERLDAGQIEITTQPFYHPILPLLIDNGWAEDANTQIMDGKAFTDSFLGTDTKSMWCSEEAFNMGVVPMIADAGLQNTVLDEQLLHDTNATLDIYQPYTVRDPASGKQINVFFRDSGISNAIGSHWNNYTDIDKATREFLVMLYDIYTTRSPHANTTQSNKVVTIALDGENFMLGQGAAKNIVEDFYAAIGQQSDWLTAKTLTQTLKAVPPTVTLNTLTEGTWSDGRGFFYDWNGSDFDKKFWQDLGQRRQYVVAYRDAITGTNDVLKQALNDIYVGETSDWTFQETPWFVTQGYRYINASRDTVTDDVLKHLTVKLATEPTSVTVQRNSTIIIAVTNNATYAYNFTVTLNALSPQNLTFLSAAKTILIQPNQTTNIEFTAFGVNPGDQTINVSLSKQGIVFLASTINVSVLAAPYSPPYLTYAAATIVVAAVAILAILAVTHRFPFRRKTKPK